MSYTIIYTFGPDGNCGDGYEIQNAFRGAMAVWDRLDMKYLPAFIPAWAAYEPARYHRTANQEAIKEIWALHGNPTVSDVDKICLASTFDNVIVRREHLPRLIDAFLAFDGNTSLKLQANILEQLLNSDEQFIAVGWNQTSVGHDDWSNKGGSDDEGNEIPYNILTMTNHWELFEDMNQFLKVKQLL